MTIGNTLDLLYFVLAIGAIWIVAFLAWLFGEAAYLIHQTNRMVKDTREKIGRFERAVLSIKDRLESSAGYLGVLAEGGKTLVNYLQAKKGKKGKRKKSDEDEE